MKENLVDYLNETDYSVGLHPVSNLKDWADDNFDEIQGVTLISATEDQLIFTCEGHTFEIYEKAVQVEEDGYDYFWDIREYSN